MNARHMAAAVVVTAALFLAGPAGADLPDTNTLLGQLGLSADEIAQVQAGKYVSLAMKPASERELVTATAFELKLSPADVIKNLKQGLFVAIDPNTIASGVVSRPASVGDLAKLTLQSGAEKQAKAYLAAKPGDDLNLSTQEIAAFAKLGANAPVTTVDEAIRAMLVARVDAYRAQGLSGIAPYARSNGERSPADELRTASQASANLKTYVPHLYDFLLAYPQAMPQGAEDAIRWTLLNANGVPTITLTQALVVPDGDAWVVIQRQFYVSTGYNTEQAIAALLPVATGTVVVYGNRTSTDQVSGFGGSAKRSIGSKILASQLQSLFDKLRATAK